MHVLKGQSHEKSMVFIINSKLMLYCTAGVVVRKMGNIFAIHH